MSDMHTPPAFARFDVRDKCILLHTGTGAYSYSLSTLNRMRVACTTCMVHVIFSPSSFKWLRGTSWPWHLSPVLRPHLLLIQVRNQSQWTPTHYVTVHNNYCDDACWDYLGYNQTASTTTTQIAEVQTYNRVTRGKQHVDNIRQDVLTHNACQCWPR